MDRQQKIIASLTHEIKRREFSIKQVQANPGGVGFSALAIEHCYLQFRRILECLAFCMVAANKHAFEAQKSKVNTDYHAVKLVRWMEAKFGEVYPTPIYQKDSPLEGIKSEFSDVQHQFLRREDFEKLYGVSGDVLHGRNPFRGNFDYKPYEDRLGDWHHKIRGLLNNHTYKTVDESYLYLVQMNSEDVSAAPTVYLFEKIREDR